MDYDKVYREILNRVMNLKPDETTIEDNANKLLDELYNITDDLQDLIEEIEEDT